MVDVGTVRHLLNEEHGLPAFFDAVRAPETNVDNALREIARTGGVTLTLPNRARIIATLWASRKRALLAELMELDEFREPGVISRACALLDAPRRTRQLNRELASLPQGQRRRRRRVESKINDLRAWGAPEQFSASASFMRVVRKWIRSIPAARLEFDCARFEHHDVWKGACDLAHPRPTDFALRYFPRCVFGESAPEGSLAADVRQLTAENLVEMLERHPRLAEAYSIIRLRLEPRALPSGARAELAARMPLGDVLWNYEELCGVDARGTLYGRASSTPPGQAAVDEVLAGRVSAGELESASAVGSFRTDNFAKLLERMLTLQRSGAGWWGALLPTAERLLDRLKAHKLELIGAAGPRTLQALAARAASDLGPHALRAVPAAVRESMPADAAGLRVAVLGDASASMQVAINAAAIVGAMMSALFEAELVFFNNRAFTSAAHPHGARTAADVIAIADAVQAGCSTAPAAALETFAREQKKIDLFIVVTDEEENTKGPSGAFFAEAFSRYAQEVHARARCSFVSFLRAAEGEGTMVRRLREAGVDGRRVSQLRLDPRRPDLSKFDALFQSVVLDAARAAEEQREPSADAQPQRQPQAPSASAA